MRISSFNINKFCGAYSQPKGGYRNPRNIGFKYKIKEIVDSLLESKDDIVFLQEFWDNKYVNAEQLFESERYTIFSNEDKKNYSMVVAITLKGSIWKKRESNSKAPFMNKILKMETQDKRIKIVGFHNTDDEIKKQIGVLFEKKEENVILGDFNDTDWIKEVTQENVEKYVDLVSDTMITFKPAQTSIDRIFVQKDNFDLSKVVFNGIIETFSSDHNVLSFCIVND